MQGIKEIIFSMDVVVNCVLLVGVAWSIMMPTKRAWPPPGKGSWQYALTWLLFYMAFLSNALLLVLDWNTWIIPNEMRFIIGVPMTVIGVLIVIWGIKTLGVKNTYGLKNGIIITGPYHFTRNPQYLGDMILFVGVSLISNSLYVVVVHLLMILVFLFAPLCEEVWLERKYGEAYKNYMRDVPRFL